MKQPQTLNKNITRFVQQFGVRRALFNDEFAYYHISKEITYAYLPCKADEHFIDFIYRTYNIDIEPYWFIFSILHEIGHHKTKLDTIDIEFEESIRALLEIIDDEYRCNELYFQLPAEQLATEWAIEYLQNHYEECWKLQRKWLCIMKHLSKKNKLF